MRRFLLIGVLSFTVSFFLTVEPGRCDVPARLDSLRSYILSLAGLPANQSDLKDTVVNKIVNIAIQRVCSDFPAIEKQDTIILGITQVGIAFNSDFERLAAVFKIQDTSLRRPIRIRGIETIEQLVEIITEWESKVGIFDQPTDVAPFADRIFEFPKHRRTTKQDTLLIHYYARDSSLQVDSSTTQVHEDYREAVVKFAIYTIFLRFGEAQAALLWANDYNSLQPGKPIITGQQ